MVVSLPVRLTSVVVLSVVVYGGLLIVSDLRSLGSSLAVLDWSFVFAALALSSLNFVVRFVRWEYFLRYLSIRIDLRNSVLMFLSSFVMTLTPAKAGEILKSVMLKSTYDVPIARSAPIVVAERITDLAGLVFLSALGGVALEHGWAIALGGAVFVVGLLSFCRFSRFSEAILRLFSRLWFLKRVVPRLSEAYEVLQTLTRLRPLAVGFAISVVAWGLQCLSLYVVAAGFPSVRLALLPALFIYAAPLIAGTVSMLPGGLGLTEASMTGLLLTSAGHESSVADATAITLIVRLCTLWWALAVGAGAYAGWRTLHAALPAAPPAKELTSP